MKKSYDILAWKVAIFFATVLLWFRENFAEEKERWHKIVKRGKFITGIGVPFEKFSHVEIRTKETFRAHRPGVMILGMHRSGTSMLSGLVYKMGFQIGDSIMKASKYEEKRISFYLV